ncbi:MAG: hypothetical protein L3J25_11680 [Flavobacteriaceae bacterium]|nr:hypothetical protein [Flavobacteriaceae bacterium]
MKKESSKLFLRILLCSFILLSNNIQSQHKNNFEAGLFNIGFGGFVGGIGAIINKKPNEKIGRVFLKGFGQGALGGYLLFESKRLVGKFAKTNNYGYVWPSKIINSAGISIIENAAANRNLWEQWHINFGFNRLEFYTKDKFKMSYRIMPFALENIINGFTKGELDINKSLKIGSFVFVTNNIISLRGSRGRALSNSILLLKDARSILISHEIIHVYQYESFSGLNPYLNKPIAKLNKNKWFKVYHKIFYTDFNSLTFQGLYRINKDYKTNFFEKEAKFYARFD